jgi:hypothetical protein
LQAQPLLDLSEMRDEQPSRFRRARQRCLISAHQHRILGLDDLIEVWWSPKASHEANPCFAAAAASRSL